MRAGKMDRRIELQSKGAPSDGDPTTGTWSTQATVWAEKMDKGGVERFASERDIAQASRAYKIRYRTDVDPTWRVKESGELWDIIGTPEGDGRRVETILMVERHDPDDAT